MFFKIIIFLQNYCSFGRSSEKTSFFGCQYIFQTIPLACPRRRQLVPRGRGVGGGPCGGGGRVVSPSPVRNRRVFISLIVVLTSITTGGIRPTKARTRRGAPPTARAWRGTPTTTRAWRGTPTTEVHGGGGLKNIFQKKVSFEKYGQKNSHFGNLSFYFLLFVWFKKSKIPIKKSGKNIYENFFCYFLLHIRPTTAKRGAPQTARAWRGTPTTTRTCRGTPPTARP